MACELGLERVLFQAVEDGELEAVRYLLDAGMSPYMTNSFSNITVMDTAIECGDVQVVQLVEFYEAVQPVLDAEVDALAATHGLSAAAVADVRALLARRVPGFQSRPPAIRAMAPPVSEPLGSSRREQLREMVEEWARLKETEAQERHGQ